MFFRAAVRHEQAVAAAQRRDENFEKMLSMPGEPLYCLGCGKASYGPLSDFGCPHCHTRAFVLPARLSEDKAARIAVDAMPPYTVETQETHDSGAANIPETNAVSVRLLASGTATPLQRTEKRTEQIVRRNRR